jgi:hypothetical protein
MDALIVIHLFLCVSVFNHFVQLAILPEILGSDMHPPFRKQGFGDNELYFCLAEVIAVGRKLLSRCQAIAYVTCK